MHGWFSRGYLPHFDRPGLLQHITFHLADSLPAHALARMQAELEPLSTDQQAILRRQRMQEFLDAGYGSCLLGMPACASAVQESLLHGDGSRYRLLAWVVMPNHVHALIAQLDWPLPKIVQSWKRHTARIIKGLLERSDDPAPLWQRDYWDRFIRDENHYMTVKRYIEENPVQAGLVHEAQEWRWGSAAPFDMPISNGD